MKGKEKSEKPEKSRRLLISMAVIILVVAVLTALTAYKKGLINTGAIRQTAENYINKAKPEEAIQESLTAEGETAENRELTEDNVPETEPEENDEEKTELESMAAEVETAADIKIDQQPDSVEILEDEKSTFYCYSKTASAFGSYEWQGYSIEKSDWETIGMIDHTGAVSGISGESIVLSLEEDEEKNKGSMLILRDCKATQNGSLYRCVVYDDIKKEKHRAVSKPVMLRVISKDFIDLVISYSDVCEAGTVIETEDIDIGFRYADEVIFPSMALENVSFLTDKVVKKDVKNNADGSVTESTTTSALEQDTYEIALGENEIDIRYKDGEKSFEGSFCVKGVDLIPPELTEVATSETTLKSGTDNPSIIAFALKGTDNYTPEDELLYALAEKDAEIGDDDYSKENIYALQVQENTTYVAYVKDMCGNTGSREVIINVKDETAPVIDEVSLKYPDQDLYCRQNQIIVKAHDDISDLEYRYTLGEGKGTWGKQNHYDADQNGNYLVEVRDAAGNTVSETIEIKNVDNVSPVIKSIFSIAKYDVNGNEIYGILQENDTDGNNEFISGILSGDNTESGKDGVPGVSGKDGSSSVVGKDGTSGISGKDGTAGKNGKDGIDGINGKDGADGRDGFDGVDGKDGADGKDGKDGSNGKNGKDGNSSYFAYADSVNGNVIKNFHRDTPLQTSKWIGVYSGTSAPTSQSQYTWSQYKTASSIEFITDPNKVRITLNPSNS